MNQLDGTWRKGSRSSESANCVELRTTPDGGVEIRDSKDSLGPVLTFTVDEYDAFIGSIVDGELRRP